MEVPEVLEVDGSMSRCIGANWKQDEDFTGHGRGSFHFTSTSIPLWELSLACNLLPRLIFNFHLTYNTYI